MSGWVVLSGPGVAIALSLEAAAATAERILVAVTKANEGEASGPETLVETDG